MVFFNYSTMQMAAKVVYYGPGLCGKTTNLQYIYSHTSRDSRGEMVSLETETDRTLFFDLLPIDVGSIAGFETYRGGGGYTASKHALRAITETLNQGGDPASAIVSITPKLLIRRATLRAGHARVCSSMRVIILRLRPS